MAAANRDVRPATASGIVAPNTTNLVLLFALDSIPVSKQRLVCRWHRNADGRLVCASLPAVVASTSFPRFHVVDIAVYRNVIGNQWVVSDAHDILDDALRIVGEYQPVDITPFR
jgi:hypothetical protein